MKRLFVIAVILTIAIVATACERIVIRSPERDLTGQEEDSSYSDSEISTDSDISDGSDESLGSDAQTSDSPQDWCTDTMASKMIRKYLQGDTSEVYSLSNLLGMTDFRGGSYCGAEVDSWSGGGNNGYYCTIYFNEDGSDVWVRINPYGDNVGTDMHYIKGKLTERFDLATGEAEPLN